MEATLSCNDVSSALPLYVGDDVDGAEARALERHLAGCATCRSELERAQSARAALKSLDAATPPVPEIWTGVRARMIEEGLLRAEPAAAIAPAARGPRARRSAFRRWAPSAAAALVLCAFGLLLSQRADERGADPALRSLDSASQGFDAAPVADVLPGERDSGASGVPILERARPVALRPLGFEEWPVEGALEPEPELVPFAPHTRPPNALPASLPPGIH